MSAGNEARGGFRFWVGVALMALSFGIYLAYPTIPFLPISGRAKVAAAVGGGIVSWGIFFIGSFLAGREGYAYLTRRASAWRNRPVHRDRT